METVKEFEETAKGLAKNPLGIIALFIVLIYGFASLVVGFRSSLQPFERIPIVWFLVVFPVIVLAVFTRPKARALGRNRRVGIFK